MRLLFVSAWYPYPPDNGARIRIFNLLKELSKRHTIHFVSFVEESSPPDTSQVKPLLELCSTVDTVPRQDYQRQYNSVIKTILSRKPPWIVLRYNHEMTRIVEKISAVNNPDIVVISQVQNLPLLEDINFNMPVILEQFEVGTIWNRLDSASGYKRVTRTLTRAIWKHYLSEHLRGIDGITVPSESEKDILLGLLLENYQSKKHIALIPNGINEEHTVYPSVKNEAATLVYQGSLKFAANLEAMEFFLSEIMPFIQQYASNVLLRITGGYDGVDVSRIIDNECVELTGYLDDVTDTVAAANVCVIPLRYGSGTRVKALESMALGTPVVSTSKGVEGIDVRDGVHVLIADKPELFAKQVMRLLADADLAMELAKNARQLVLERYTWTKLGKQLSDFCETVSS